MGSNVTGALGLGRPEVPYCFSPSLVTGLIDQKALKISAGGGHTMVLMGNYFHFMLFFFISLKNIKKNFLIQFYFILFFILVFIKKKNLSKKIKKINILENGEVKAWGLNDQGQLGLNSRENQYSPQKIQHLQVETPKIIDLDAGYNHSFLLTSEFTPISFGANTFGQLGNGTKLKQLYPKKLPLLPEKILKIACGCNFTLLLTETGQIYSCGDNSSGQLGIGKAIMSSQVPIIVKFPSETQNFIQISAGRHSSALTNAGSLYIWGMSLLFNSYEPQKIDLPFKIKQVAIGGDYGVVITSEGGLFVWGRNDNGELGLGDYSGRMEIEENSYFKGKKVLKISAGGNHVMAIGENSLDYASSDLLFKSVEEEDFLELKEIETPKTEKKKDMLKNQRILKENMGDIRFEGKNNANLESIKNKYIYCNENENNPKENNASCHKNNSNDLTKTRKELSEISLNSMGTKNFQTNEKNREIDDLQKINSALNKNIDNLNTVLKVYIEEEKLKKINWPNYIKKNEIENEMDNEEKVKYLIEKLQEKENDMAEFKLKLAKKEALEHGLLYRISCLEDCLNVKEKEISFLKNQLDKLQ